MGDPEGVEFVVNGGDFLERVGGKEPEGLRSPQNVCERDIEGSAAGVDNSDPFFGALGVALRLVTDLIEVGGKSLVENDAELGGKLGWILTLGGFDVLGCGVPVAFMGGGEESDDGSAGSGAAEAVRHRRLGLKRTEEEEYEGK